MNQLFTIGIGLHLLDGLSSPMRAAMQSTDRMSASMRSLSGACSQFTRGFSVMTNTLRKARAPFDEVFAGADKLKALGRGMALKGSASMLLGLAPSVDAAGFEKSMAEVATLTNMGVREFQNRYGKQIIDLSVGLGQDPALVVKGMYQAISAGVDPEDAIEFMGKSGQAAIAGVSDIFTSTDLLTSIKNAFGLPLKEMGRINDIIFQTVRKGKTTYAEIANSFSQVGAAAASAGISLEHVQAAAAQMTLSGVKTERAYTALRYGIDALVAPSVQAKEAFKRLGLEVNAETVRQKDLLGVMDELMHKMQAFSEKEQAGMIADIFGSQEAQMFAKDFGTNTDKFKAMLRDIKGSSGVADAAFSKMAETSSHEFDKIKQTFRAISIALGASILPPLNALLRAVSAILRPVADFAQRHKMLSGVLLGGAVAVSAVAAALGILGIAAGLAIKGYGYMSMAAELFTTHKRRMITAVRALTGALMPNISAMAVWTAGMARAPMAGLLAGIKAMTIAAKAFSITALAGIKALGIALLTTPVGWIVLALTGAALLIYKFWGPVSGFFKGVFRGVAEALRPLEPAWDVFKRAALVLSPVLAPLKIIYDLIKRLVKPVEDAGGAAEKIGLGFGRAIGRVLVSVLTLPAKMFDAGVEVIESLWKGMKSVINRPVEAVKEMAGRMRGLLPFSPAKEGPFRDLHKIRLIETIAETMRPAPAVNAMERVTRAVKEQIADFEIKLRTPELNIAAYPQPFPANAAEDKGYLPAARNRGTLRQEYPAFKNNAPQTVAAHRSQSAAAGGAVTVNYHPTVNITGNSGSRREPQDIKGDFRKMLSEHREMIEKMVLDMQSKQRRLAY